MNNRRSIFAHVGALLLLIVGLFFVVYRADRAGELPVSDTVASSTISQSPIDASTTTVQMLATTTATSTLPKKTSTSTSPSTPKAKKASIQATKSTSPVATSSPNDILRIENPYTTPPLAFESINVSARAALVNIYCSTISSGTLQPITGSGIMIDSRGVVLTNAHVAQYVLISETGKTDLHCEVRTGAPAVSKWIPVVMYIPPVWIEQHAADIIKSHALGTGEHDYALLYMYKTVDGSPRPASYAAVTPDVREAIAFVDDNVLAASYPVEFEGSGVIQSDLYPVTSITTVKQLLTFSVGSADAISLGGIIGAQSGSSGGGVVNQWNKVVGLITTTSEGATTGERDLHAITAAYINRDLIHLTGTGLLGTLAADPKAAVDAFIPESNILAQKLFDVITRR